MAGTTGAGGSRPEFVTILLCRKGATGARASSGRPREGASADLQEQRRLREIGGEPPATAPDVTGGGAVSGGVPRRSQSAAEGHPAPLPSNLSAKRLPRTHRKT